MTPERWQEIKEVLDQVLDCATPERKAFLDRRCGGDDELRREIVSLLESEDEATDFIETPLFRIRSEDQVPMAEGERVGPYRIVREVGRGGMGAVYLAQRDDQQFDRRVALKLIRRGMDSEEILDRFRAERQILAHLDHENIGKLLDGGTTEDGRPYFVMEHVEGEPIDRYCDARKLTIRQRLELFRQVCAAVQFAHRNLVVHRDLKPGNILITADGVPKLLDFGIAKLLHPEQEAFALTRLELRPMTPAFASPEQVRGEAISTASDVYSLGVLLYRLLTGRSPYRQALQTDPDGLSRAIRDEVPAKPSGVVLKAERVAKPDGTSEETGAEALAEARGATPRSLRRQLEGDLDNIVLKAMSKEPDRRYASAGQLADDLERQLRGLPVAAQKDTKLYRTKKFVERHRVWVAVAAVALLFLVGFSISVFVLYQRALRERDRAETETQRTQAVLGFVNRLFENADPDKTYGANLTARQVLDQGVAEIESGGLADQPLVEADVREVMASVYRSLGLNEQALGLIEKALAVRRAHAAEDPARLATTLHNEAGILRDLGRPEEAEAMVITALGLQEKHGLKGLDYAKGLSSLGELRYKKGDAEGGIQLYREVLRIKQGLPATDDNDLATSFNNLGTVLVERGALAEAEPLLEKALELRTRTSGGRPTVALSASFGALAALREDQKRYDEAQTLYEKSVAMRREIYPEGNAALARTLNNLGRFLEARGRLDRAEEALREAVQIADRDEEFSRRDRASYLRNLASILAARGQGGEAERLAREAVAVYRERGAPPHSIAHMEGPLGSALAAQKRYPEAESLLTAAYAALLPEPEKNARQLAEMRRRLFDLYTAWGKPEKAAAFRAEP